MIDRLDWLAAVLALVPAVVRLLRNRSLFRHIGDPALPERLLGSRNALAATFSSILAIEIVFFPWRNSVWSVPLLIVTFMLAGWPLRRALFNESWAFPTYVWFYARLIVGIYGFWLVLMAAPWLTAHQGWVGWASAAALATVLLIWNAQYAAVLRFVLRAQPVTAPALLDGFRAVIAKTGLSAPGIEFVDMRGGVLVNAIALPGLRRSTVLFTSTLIERMTVDEIVAIFAHEVAHLEHFSPAYLRKFRPIGWLLILLACLLGPLMSSTTALSQVVSFWPVVIVIYNVVIGMKRQQHETASDRRAVELTGNPEALVSGLVKLHELARLPRRLDPNVEVQASHPSLTRRIQAIRAAGNVPHATLHEPVVLKQGDVTVSLHAEHLVWSEGTLSSFTLGYASLDELRVEADAGGATRLTASDPAGRRWTMALAAGDVARAQAALDVVDVQLRATPAGAGIRLGLMRLATIFGALAAVLSTQLAAIIVAVLAAIAVERPLLLAAAASSIVAGLIALRSTGVTPLVMLTITAAVLAWLALNDRRDVISRRTWRLVVLVGALAAIAFLPIAMGFRSTMTLHQAARDWPSFAIFSVAFAAAAWSRRRPAWTGAAAVTAAVGIGALALGTTFVAEFVVDDPFLSLAARVQPVALPSAPEARFHIDAAPEAVVVSPNARAIAAMSEDDYEDYVFSVGRPGHPLIDVSAEAALFIDDDRLLLLHHTRGVATLRLIHVDRADAPLWSQDFELSRATLSVDGGRQSWELLGVAGASDLQRISGTIDGAIASTRSWQTRTPRSDTARQTTPIAVDGDRVLVHETSYERQGINVPGMPAQLAAWLNPWRTESRFTVIDGRDQREVLHSTLDVWCRPSTVSASAPVCSAYDGARTHVFSMNIDGVLSPLALLERRANVESGEQWITGWSGRPFALHLATGRYYEVDGRRGYLSAGGDYLGLVSIGERGSRVDLYRVSAR